jgi:hypothetical protein
VAWINLARLRLDAGDRTGARTAAERAVQRADATEPAWRDAARATRATTDESH